MLNKIIACTEFDDDIESIEKKQEASIASQLSLWGALFKGAKHYAESGEGNNIKS